MRHKREEPFYEWTEVGIDESGYYERPVPGRRSPLARPEDRPEFWRGFGYGACAGLALFLAGFFFTWMLY